MCQLNGRTAWADCMGLHIQYERNGANFPLQCTRWRPRITNRQSRSQSMMCEGFLRRPNGKTFPNTDFCILIGCYGPSVALFSDDAVTCLDLKLGKTHFAQLSKRAKEVRPLVIKSCLEVQRVFIEEVFLKDNANAELRKGFAWAKSDSLIGVPAIDLLYYYGSK